MGKRVALNQVRERHPRASILTKVHLKQVSSEQKAIRGHCHSHLRLGQRLSKRYNMHDYMDDGHRKVQKPTKQDHPSQGGAPQEKTKARDSNSDLLQRATPHRDWTLLIRRLTILCPTFDMSGKPEGAKRPLERPLDGGVGCHLTNFAPLAVDDSMNSRDELVNLARRSLRLPGLRAVSE